MRRLPILALAFFTAYPQAGYGQPPVMEPGPKSPEESLKCMRPRPGFTVELMAAEPLVMDPIAFAWGADGKLWVVEMGDYPLGVDGKGKPGGRVKFLEKTKGGDGPYDKATVFLDNLGFPTGVTPWGKGVLVTCAPDIFYAEDTDGDGKADKKEVLFTGFAEGNQQHRVNGLVWGLDNWLYGANGDSGGKVKSIKTGKVVDIRGRDFRLKPDTGEIEAATGQTQFGRSCDDWGNWFGNNNSNPMYHFVLDDHYLRRNPFLLPPDPRVQVSVKPGASAVYPVSKPLPRFNDPNALNHFTSACSAIVYRDELFGPEFVGNSFVSEPVHNLIHREVMKPKGVTFTSQRADDEQQSEFLASTDNWFRPTTIATGPDGALWVADMYRYVIEHPEWIPKDWQKKLDLRAGHDKGRIYRIYPKDRQPRAIPRLDKIGPKELVALLESPNGWVRDMAQQLLVSNRRHADGHLPQDGRTAQKELSIIVEKGKKPTARLQALCTLDGMNALSRPDVVFALEDSHPAVRKHALRCLEYSFPGWFFVFEELLAKMQKDPDPQVRLQLACTLGTWDDPGSGKILAQLLCQEAEDRYLFAAGLSSINQKNSRHVFASLAAQPQMPPQPLVPLLRVAKQYADAGDVAALLLPREFLSADIPSSKQLLWLGDVLDALEQSKTSLATLLEGYPTGRDELRGQLTKWHAEARRMAINPTGPHDHRQRAIRVLGRGIGDDREDRKLLAGLLTPQTPDLLQAAAIQSLAKGADPNVARVLLGPWKGYSPALRAQALDVLLSRPPWTKQLAEALDKNMVPASEIDTPRRQRLLQHPDAEVRDVAAKVFAASSSPDRNKLVIEYMLTIPEQTDSQRGAKLFAKTCAACHKLGDVGQQVGPELASVGDKSVQGLLVAILDPNRAVEPRYVNYLAITKDGRTLTGMIASETSTSVTLVGTDGKAHNLLRNEIEELTSTGKSLMPEGLEKDLPPQEMADLIAFVRSSLPVPPRKTFPGNQPETVRPGAGGILKLPAAKASIYGPSLELEQQYGNLGFWSSPDDHAVWTLELAKGGTFDVWFDYACDDSSAGNTFTLRVAGEQLSGKVAGTVSWDTYRRVKVGPITLPAGKYELTLRSVGPIRGALIDLKEVQLTPAK
jgi:putative membrane-bound dehydrogenase-like protein